jgi:diguanylate cyclase (GGDEF)-like protein
MGQFEAPEKRERVSAPVSAPVTTSRPNAVLRLQRLAGNRATTKILRSPAVTETPAPNLAAPPDARQAVFEQRASGLGLKEGQIAALLSAAGVATEDSTATLFRGAKEAAASGLPVLYLRADVTNLGGLNEARGHTGADAVLAEIRGLTEQAVRGVGGDVTPVAASGPTFGFLVVGRQTGDDNALAQSLQQAGQQATTAIAQYAKATGLDGIRHPKQKDLTGIGLTTAVETADEAAAAAVKRDIAKADSAAEARASLEAKGLSKKDKAKARFTSVNASREEAFRKLAASFGLAEDKASTLWNVFGASRTDALTGFEKAAGRAETATKAIDHVTKTGAAAIYVEVDVRNLGGLNAKLGIEKADEVFARISRITENTMAAVDADAIPFRHGGDEFSFIVVSRRPTSVAALEVAVAVALQRATKEVKAATADVASVPHTKRQETGTGISWGTSELAPGRAIAEVFKEADSKVERKKSPTSVP